MPSRTAIAAAESILLPAWDQGPRIVRVTSRATGRTLELRLRCDNDVAAAVGLGIVS